MTDQEKADIIIKRYAGITIPTLKLSASEGDGGE